MKVTDCRLHRSARSPADFPADGRPEIAFLGRSNVGKSSLLNRLVGTRGMARVSKTPGRTREIGFYLVNERVYFVDLPGYGYARVSRTMREAWRDLVDAYFDRPGHPDLAVHLVDARHEPTDLDAELQEWLAARRVRSRVVLTKSDKLPGSQRARALEQVLRRLALPADEKPIPVSAVTGDGVVALWQAIEAACAARPPQSTAQLR